MIFFFQSIAKFTPSPSTSEGRKSREKTVKREDEKYQILRRKLRKKAVVNGLKGKLRKIKLSKTWNRFNVLCLLRILRIKK